MDIETSVDGTVVRVALEGRLDTNTAPELQEALDPLLDGSSDLTFDFSRLDYVSSAGLRVLMIAYKRQAGKTVAIEHASDDVREVLDITGFSNLFKMQ